VPETASEPTIRRAVPDDAVELAELFWRVREQSVPAIPMIAHPRETVLPFVREVLLPDFEVHVAVLDGRMIGFLALFGVSVQTAVVYISYANELRLGGFGIAEATRAAALLRLRPIMMTALVAALGLLPAALSTGVGSDTQKPFALVIVGGLFSRLLISVFLMRRNIS